MSDADSMGFPQMGEFLPSVSGVTALDYESIDVDRSPDGSRSLRLRLRDLPRTRVIVLTKTAAAALAEMLSPSDDVTASDLPAHTEAAE